MAVAVATKTNTSGGEDNTSWAIGQPSPTSGRLRILALSVDGIGGFAWPDAFSNAGYNPLGYTYDASQLSTLLAYKVLDGNSAETGDITAFGSSENYCSVVADLTGFDPHGAPEWAFVRSNSSTDPNPPSLDPAGWATLTGTGWIAVACTDGDVACTAIPSGYGDGSLLVSADSTAGDRCGLGWAFLATNNSSEDPGTFTSAATRAYHSYTVGVPPEPATPAHATVLNGDGGQGIITSASSTHDISCVISGSGSDRRMFVFAGCDPGIVRAISSVVLDPAGAAIALSRCTDGTTSATIAVDTDRGQLDVFELLDTDFPSAGTYTLRVTRSSSCRGYVNAKVVQGADQSANLTAVATATTSGASTLTASPSAGSTEDCLAISGSYCNSTTDRHRGGVTCGGARMMGRGFCLDATDSAAYMFALGPAVGTGSQTVVSSDTGGDPIGSSFRTMIALLVAPAAGGTSADGTIAAVSALTGSGAADAQASGSVSAVATFTGSGAADAAASGVIASVSTFAGAARASVASSGVVSSVATFTGSAEEGGTADGTIAAVSTLTGEASTPGSASGAITSSSVLTGTSAATAVSAAAVTSTSALTGASTGRGLGTGTITAASTLSGAVTLRGLVSASASLVGSVAARASSVATVAAAAVLTGAARAVYRASGVIAALASFLGIAVRVPSAGAAASQRFLIAAPTEGRFRVQIGTQGAVLSSSPAQRFRLINRS